MTAPRKVQSPVRDRIPILDRWAGNPLKGVLPLNTISISTAIAGLKADWHTLNDLDRGRAVHTILSTGVSGRGLATALGLSESTVRLTLLVLEANPADQSLLLQGLISRNELIRRVKGTSSPSPINLISVTSRESAKDPEPEPVRAHYAGITNPIKGCKEILDWMRNIPLHGVYAIQTLKEARMELEKAEAAGSLPRDRAPEGMTAQEIARRCEPNREDFPSDVAWYARWLALSGFHIIPNNDVRGHAFRMAIKWVSGASDRSTFGKSSPQP